MNYSKDEIIVLGISLFAIILLSMVLGAFLKNKSEKVKKIPFLTITILLVVMEAIKQIRSVLNGYSMWSFPLHFCSTYFIWFSLANFTKGKFQKAMQTVAVVSSFYLVALFYFNPTSIIGDACKHVFLNFGTFHTFFFHHLVILYFFLSLTLKQFDFKKEHSIYWLITIATYYLIAVTFAHIFDVNYMNILTSNIPFMESLRQATGQVFYTFVLGLLTVGVGAIIILILSYLTNKRRNKNV